MIRTNPFLLTDGYKVGHHKMYPQGTTLVYSNFTPRSNKYAPKGWDEVVSFGQQMVMQEIVDIFEEDFFGGKLRHIMESRVEEFPEFKKGLTKMRDKVCGEVQKEYSLYLGEEYDVSHIEKLWDLGYLPIKVKALPEGTTVPMGVPLLTIYNTKPEFFWLTNFLETLLSTLLWKPITSATIAHNFRKNIVDKYIQETDKENPMAGFLGHDFSMRGLDSIFATMASGLGHALSFSGSDSLPVIKAARYYYGAQEGVIHSVNATEHSVMCAGTKEDELETYRYLMQQFPKGILSIVSDTWNLWDVLTKHLPALKEEILARDGKIVIRPDSGNPVDIICGKRLVIKNGDDYKYDDSTPESKGVIELLWELFGGTINSQGYKVLDPHIGAIYGDSINEERAIQICERLKAKGFASTNVVLGIGSFTYQFNTRDTFGMAMKATYCEIEAPNSPIVEERPIFKNPITDDGVKKSAKGLLLIVKDENSKYKLIDNCSWDQEDGGELITIFQDGKFYNTVTFEEIKARLE